MESTKESISYTWTTLYIQDLEIFLTQNENKYLKAYRTKHLKKKKLKIGVINLF